jgi:hypothetical protein
MKTSSVVLAILFAATAPAALASSASEREYQRGYNDCLHGRYDQNQHGESYKRGCRAAEEGGDQGRSSPQQTGKARISDLKGMDSIKAFDVMTSRGFTSVDTISEGNALYGIYYNAATGQCVQLTNANDRVESADDIGTHPKCR